MKFNNFNEFREEWNSNPQFKSDVKGIVAPKLKEEGKTFSEFFKSPEDKRNLLSLANEVAEIDREFLHENMVADSVEKAKDRFLSKYAPEHKLEPIPVLSPLSMKEKLEEELFNETRNEIKGTYGRILRGEEKIKSVASREFDADLFGIENIEKNENDRIKRIEAEKNGIYERGISVDGFDVDDFLKTKIAHQEQTEQQKRIRELVGNVNDNGIDFKPSRPRPQ